MGGTFRGDTSLEIQFGSGAAANITVKRVGPDLDSGGAVDLRLAHPGVTTEIWGGEFAVDGVPIHGFTSVQASSGTLTGYTYLGGQFSWTFERSNGAPLVVATPEPAGCLVPGLIVLGTLARRRIRNAA